MKKTIIFITFFVISLIYFYQKTEKNVLTRNEIVFKKEKNLINSLKNCVRNIKSEIHSNKEISSNLKLLNDIQYVNNYNGNIIDLQLCDKVYEIDSIINLSINDDSRNLFVGQRCQKEIKEYNIALKSFFNSSIWIRNRLINKGKIKKRVYFEYRLNDLKPSHARALKNAELDSLMLEGLKKK